MQLKHTSAALLAFDTTNAASDVICPLSMDDYNYCQSKPPVVVDETIHISVCGDATYSIPKGSAPCSGPSSEAMADGAVCPKKDDQTTEDCRKNIMSFLTSSSGTDATCQAKENAVCVALKSGAWGCVFPSNANTANGCLAVHDNTGDIYEKDDAGKVEEYDNKYPKPTATHKATGVVDTKDFPMVPAQVVITCTQDADCTINGTACNMTSKECAATTQLRLATCNDSDKLCSTFNAPVEKLVCAPDMICRAQDGGNCNTKAGCLVGKVCSNSAKCGTPAGTGDVCEVSNDLCDSEAYPGLVCDASTAKCAVPDVTTPAPVSTTAAPYASGNLIGNSLVMTLSCLSFAILAMW